MYTYIDNIYMEKRGFEICKNPIKLQKELGKELDNKLATANYGIFGTKKNDETEPIDYIFYCFGTRIGNHTKTAKITDNAGVIKNIIKAFKKRDCKVQINMVLMGVNDPISLNGEHLAKELNKLAKEETCHSINLLGVSKASVMYFDMLKHLDEDTKKKCNLHMIAAPFTGTKMASTKYMYEVIDKALKKLFGFAKPLYNLVHKIALTIYDSMNSHAHMDYDIALPDGVIDNTPDKYDPNLIKNIYSEENIKAMNDMHDIHVYITGALKSPLTKLLRPTDFALAVIDKIAMDGKSDGFVTRETQESLGKTLKERDVKLDNFNEHYMDDTTHGLIYDPKKTEYVCCNIYNDFNDEDQSSLAKLKIHI